MDYIRYLLIDLSKGKYNQEIPDNHQLFTKEVMEKASEYYYHLTLLGNEGLITMKTSKTKPFILLNECPKLTWAGNDFLDAIENDNIWNKTKEVVKQKGLEVGQLSFEVIKTFATTQIKNLLGIDPS